MAYYPWVNTSIVQSNEIDYRNFDSESIETLKGIVASDLNLPEPDKQNDKQKQMQQQIDQLAKVAPADWITGNGDDESERPKPR